MFDKGNATNLHVFHVEGDSTITTNSSNVSQDYCNMEVSGVCSVFCTVDTGIFSRSFGDGGDELFPGTSAGAVQASTYSWYR